MDNNPLAIHEQNIALDIKEHREISQQLQAIETELASLYGQGLPEDTEARITTAWSRVQWIVEQARAQAARKAGLMETAKQLNAEREALREGLEDIQDDLSTIKADMDANIHDMLDQFSDIMLSFDPGRDMVNAGILNADQASLGRDFIQIMLEHAVDLPPEMQAEAQRFIVRWTQAAQAHLYTEE